MVRRRHNALEIVGTRAYRFAVFGCVIEGDKIVSAEHSEAPVDVLLLPLAREAATTYAWAHWEDLGADGVADIIARLTRPARPLV